MARVKVDKSLLRQAAERCRYANGIDLVDAMRQLQVCFGWQTVLALIDELDDAQERGTVYVGGCDCGCGCCERGMP